MDEEKTKEFKDIYARFYLESTYSKNDEDERRKLGVDNECTNDAVENFALNELNSFRKSESNSEVKLDERLIAWKAGRLEPEMVKNKSSCEKFLNGYGKEIKNLLKYIEAINDKDFLKNIREKIDKHEVEQAYNDLKELNIKYKVDNLGSVYIITLLYFISGGKYPIYDKFAHKAVKALYFNENPQDIYVGEAPGKRETKKVMAIYREYCWLLKEVFGTYDIPRNLDQALWVYGHCKKKYGDESGEDSIRNIFNCSNKSIS